MAGQFYRTSRDLAPDIQVAGMEAFIQWARSLHRHWDASRKQDLPRDPVAG